MSLRFLKAPQLKLVAEHLGLNTAGTKSALETDIRHASRHSHLACLGHCRKVKLMSIDMGIRNLAFCHMHIDMAAFNRIASFEGDGRASASSESPVASFASLDFRAKAPAVLNSVAVTAWQRIALSSPSLSTPGSSGSALRLASPVAQTETETFDPPHLAPLALSFLTTHVLPHSPDVVLIERQRHRSGGGRAVLEWTFRVNMLESMLWALLTGLGHAGRFDGRVHAVNPSKVAKYWTVDQFGPEAAVAVKGKRLITRSKAEKEGKISTVHSWLDHGTLAFENGQASEMRDAFLDSVTKRARRNTKGVVAAEGTDARKVDDLADSLLQGVTWLEWEANRLRMREALKREDSS